MSFVERPLSAQETIGEQLHHARVGRNLSVLDVAQRTRISSRFIDSLEHGAYKELPGPVYVRKYVRELCLIYALPFERLAEQLSREQSASQPKEIRLSPKDSSRPLWIPSLIRWGGVAVVVAVIGAYFTWQVVRLLTPPPLTVIQPAQDIVLDIQLVVVKGSTQPGAQVTINGEAANVSEQGEFEEEVALRPGLNRLEIVAQTKYSSQSIIVRQIVVEKPK